VFLLLLLHRLTLIIFKNKNSKIVVLFSYECSSNQCKTSRFPAKFSKKTPMKSAVFLTIIFQWNLLRKFPWISCKIGCFYREFVSGNPMKFDFFSATYQKPCLIIKLQVLKVKQIKQICRLCIFLSQIFLLKTNLSKKINVSKVTWGFHDFMSSLSNE